MNKFFFVTISLVLALSFFSGCFLVESPPIPDISGVVTDVEYLAEGSSFNASDIMNTIVTFEDGRIKAFNGISNEVFQIGRVHVIEYDPVGGNIVSVVIQP